MEASVAILGLESGTHTDGYASMGGVYLQHHDCSIPESTVSVLLFIMSADERVWLISADWLTVSTWLFCTSSTVATVQNESIFTLCSLP